ncbi:MAG: TIR domain-containing protein [Anaerolineae bacterium]|nr:TIR domain-containing protein [Anaerolineae bacterium]
MSRCFISYSRRNTNFAERLARDLNDAGVEVWIDFRQIHAGERWKDEIRRGVERSEVIVIVLSPDSVVSEWVQFEINYGREKNKVLLPIMVVDCYAELRANESLAWLLDVHFIKFEGRYEQGFPELLKALPGKRKVGVFDTIDSSKIPNPFKGLEAFQQTDAAFFFGREGLIKKALAALKPGRPRRFLAVVGASGSGKSSLVRAGVIPQVRSGALPGSDQWRVAIFTPGDQPTRALATRIAPMLPEDVDADAVQKALSTGMDGLSTVAQRLLIDAPSTAMLMLIVDQFEETFTRAPESAARSFIGLLEHAATVPNGRCIVVLTMRADFFDRLGRYPDFAELFEADQLLIVTEMTQSNLLRAITGPAEAVSLIYEDGLADRILEDVRRQPGSLPLLQYALTELYKRREGRRLTNAAYDAIGGVEQALARHAEELYVSLGVGQQDIVKRVLLRLIEIGDDAIPTRRRVARSDLTFVGVSDEAVQEIVDRLTAPDSRLLVTSREIRTHANQTASTTVWVEVGHEALIREWARFQSWVEDDMENLRLGAELLKSAADWDSTQRDAAYLLTGTRLARAEDWLESGGDANALQRAFIRASVELRERTEETQREQAERELTLQRRSAQRLRMFVGVLLLALVVTAGLVLFAFSERDRADGNAQLAATNAAAAEANAQRAQANFAQANSFALSALANRALGDGDSQLAVSLGVEANLVASPPPPQSSLTLAEVAFAPGVRRAYASPGTTISAVALSADERLAAAASPDGVTVFDALSGEVVATLALTTSSGISALAINPDGTRIVTGSESGAISLWDATTGALMFEFTRAHNRAVNSLSFSSDHAKLVSAGSDNRVVVWDVASGSPITEHTLHRGSVTGARFWPQDDRIVVSAGRDSAIIAYDTVTNAAIRTLSTNMVHLSLALRPDGLEALTGGDGGRVQTWPLDLDLQQAQQQQSVQPVIPLGVATYTGHTTTTPSVAVAYADDGRLVISAGADGQLLVWDTATTTLLRSFTVPGTGEFTSLAVSADGDQVLSGGASAGAAFLRLWDVTSAAIMIDMPGHTGRAVAVFRPDGRTILSGGRDDDPENPDDDQQGNNLRVFDIATGRTVQQLTGHTNLVGAVDVSPDGRYAVSGSFDNTVRVWDIAAGTGIQVGTHTNQVIGVRFTPDGYAVIAVSRGGQIMMWHANGDGLIRQFIDPAGDITSVQALALSADGSLLLTGGDESIVRLWDVATGDLLETVTIEDRAVRALGFHPDGTHFVVGSVNGSLTLWSTDGDSTGRLTGHSRAIITAEYTPDGMHVLSTSFDGTLRVWDIVSGFEVRRFDTNDEPGVTIQTADISSDGQLVLTALSDGRLRIWRLYPTLESLLAWTVANRVVTPLTDCTIREQFQLEPCDANGQPPAQNLPPLPPLNPPPQSVITLEIGGHAVINTTNGTRQFVRPAPGNFDNEASTLVDDGTRVVLQSGPVLSAGFWWWEVETETGVKGWVAEYIPAENIQSLATMTEG